MTEEQIFLVIAVFQVTSLIAFGGVMWVAFFKRDKKAKPKTNAEIIIRWVRRRRKQLTSLREMDSDLWGIYGGHYGGTFNVPHEASEKLKQARELIKEATVLAEAEPEYPPADEL